MKSLRLRLRVETSSPIREYTSIILKKLGIKTKLVSPLFIEGKNNFELGELVTPTVMKGNKQIIPTYLNGEYIAMITDEDKKIRHVENTILRDKKKKIKIDNIPVNVTIEDYIEYKTKPRNDTNKITLYLKSPYMSRNLRHRTNLYNYSLSPIYLGVKCVEHFKKDIISCIEILEKLNLTYYYPTSIKPLIVPLNKKPVVGLVGKITMITEDLTPEEAGFLETIYTLGVGIGSENGFGVVAWKWK